MEEKMPSQTDSSWMYSPGLKSLPASPTPKKLPIPSWTATALWWIPPCALTLTASMRSSRSFTGKSLAPGTPFIYQGEEIGMVNVKYDSIEDYNCCYTKGDYHSMVALGASPKEALDALAPRSRDNARTPYQWDDSENAGFTTGKPWLKVNPKYAKINLAEDRDSKDSIFAFYQKLTRMRREDPAIIDGDLKFLLEDHEDLIVYLRRCARQTLLVVANLSGKTVPFPVPEALKENLWERRLTNREDTQSSLDTGRDLLPWELEIYELAK